MADYGVRIYHPDGSHFDFNERSTVCRVLGSGEQGNRGGLADLKDVSVYTFSTGLRVPEGYDWWLWQSFNANQNWGIATLGSRQAIGPSGSSVATPYLDDNRVINVRWDFTPSDQRIRGNYISKLWQRPGGIYGAVAWPVSQSRDYGFQIYGVNNLAGVFDTSQVSYLMWKGETDIVNGWSPQNVHPGLSVNNCLCFFYTTDPNHIIGIDSDRRYRVWKNGRKADAVRAKVCIFGNGAPLSPLADYGMEVWSVQTGQRVYNSGRDVLIRPQLVPMNAALRLEGNQIIYSPVRVPGIRRPMYAPTNTGAGLGAGVAFNDRGDSMKTFYTWVSSDGYFLYQLPGGQQNPLEGATYAGFIAYERPDFVHGVNPVMVINAEDYFVF
ncbi:hypothetical protein R5S71_004814 [Salmonella enterica]|nr:hypothetical protein [Salmonella enterica subsp. enterica serovar Duisburg]EAS5079765.1 hypothetical protein [Salmonella enterica]EHT5515212.1 hypothetical protein [Salmonella enterica subsp. enterica serovar Sandiego]OIN35717.1 hypothetical protein AO411_2027245 [Salmonella enterica subsp. enterica serovar Sarajane]EAU9597626.1 hypothetical protein [Salmonella enterica]